MQDKLYATYIMMNKHNTVSYIGVSGFLYERVRQHKQKIKDGFTSKYNINKLVYYEEYDYVYHAIERKKQLKRWSRKKKVDLIKKINFNFNDLSQDWEVQDLSTHKILNNNGRDDKGERCTY